MVETAGEETGATRKRGGRGGEIRILPLGLSRSKLEKLL